MVTDRLSSSSSVVEPSFGVESLSDSTGVGDLGRDGIGADGDRHDGDVQGPGRAIGEGPDGPCRAGEGAAAVVADVGQARSAG